MIFDDFWRFVDVACSLMMFEDAWLIIWCPHAFLNDFGAHGGLPLHLWRLWRVSPRESTREYFFLWVTRSTTILARHRWQTSFQPFDDVYNMAHDGACKNIRYKYAFGIPRNVVPVNTTINLERLMALVPPISQGFPLPNPKCHGRWHMPSQPRHSFKGQPALCSKTQDLMGSC